MSSDARGWRVLVFGLLAHVIGCGDTAIAPGSFDASESGSVVNPPATDTAADFGYPTAKTFYYAIPPAQFRDWDSGEEANYRLQTGGFACLGTSATFDYDWSGQAPVHLPQGATVKDFACYWYDNSSTEDIALTARLYKRTITSTGSTQMVQLARPAVAWNSVALETLASTSISSAVVDNASEQFFIYLNFNTDPGSYTSAVRFYGCRIEYELSTLAP